MNSSSSFVRWLARALVLACLMVYSSGPVLSETWLGGVSVPTIDVSANAVESAGQAEDKANWIKQLGFLGDIISGISSLYDKISDAFKKLFKLKDLTTALETWAEKMKIKAKAKMTDAEINQGVQNVFTKEAMRIRLNHVQPRNEHLCKAVMVHQLAKTTDDFERAVQVMAASAADSMYRGAKKDGSGPQFAYDHVKSRCKQKFASPIDYPSECVDTSVTGTDGRKIGDADLSLCTMTGGQVLKMPSFKSESANGVTYSYPDPQTTEEKFWTAGLYYCLNLAGPRPTPPYGEKLAEPGNSTAMAQWSSCKARQSGILAPCFALLAYNTRPNDGSPVIAEQQKRCEAAKRAKVTLPKSFEDCQKGLSKREAEFVESAMCKSDQAVLSQTHAGAKDYRLVRDAVRCAVAQNTAQDNENAKMAALAIAVAGSLDLKGCWAEVEKAKH